MTVLSFDVGTRTLSVCVVSKVDARVHVLEWRILDLHGEDKKLTMHDLSERCVKRLAELELMETHKPDTVLIETQRGGKFGNATMMSISHVLHAFVVTCAHYLKVPCNVVFMSPTLKIAAAVKLLPPEEEEAKLDEGAAEPELTTRQKNYQFYKKNKVKFLRVSYQYYQALKKGPEQRFNFAVRLSQLLEFDEPIVYMDEASFHLWLRKTHTWTYSDRPVRIVLGQNRCSGITVFGAIGAHMDLPAFSLETGTTGEAFGRFLKKIRVWMDTDRKLYLVLDNAPAHRTQVNRDLAARLNIELLYMPPYTPELNSIEPLWSVIKRDFKSCAESRNMVRMQQEDFHNLL